MNKEYLHSFQKGIFQGVGFIFIILLSIGTVWAVSVAGTINSFSDGEILSAGKLNTNFASLKTAIESIEKIPAGTINAYGGTSAPAGWFICDGASVSQATYSNLYAAIGCNFGCTGANFNLPDLRGRFLRGRDGGSGRDPDSGTRTAMNVGGNTADNVGSVQGDELKSHSHSYSTYGGTDNDRDDSHTGVGLAYPSGSTSGATGGSETRPVNAYVNWIVKY